MVENKNISLSTTILEQKCEEVPKSRSKKAPDLNTQRVTPRIKVHDESSCDLIDRANLIKALLEQEIVTHKDIA